MASATSAASRQIVIILGAGPGLGYSCAKIFARQGHPIALLSRNLSTLQDLSAKLQKDASIDESRVRAYSVDSTKKSDIEDAFKKIQNESWGKERAYVHTGIFNPGGGFAVKPFLDFSEQDLKNGLDTQVVGCFNFAQSFLRAVQSNPQWDKPTKPTDTLGNLLITGATASVKGSAKFATFAASKFALRALAESIAREYGPLGIHCAHFIIDGLIVTPATTERFEGDFDPNSRMNSDSIAEVYLNTARQSRDTFQFHVDLRPSNEKW